MYEFEHLKLFLTLLSEVRLNENYLALLVLLKPCRFQFMMIPYMQSTHCLTAVIDTSNCYI
ncbi:hypothetical protein RchiOBHm_Chr5g0034851 [Rosa chinensis]|uniref:Uncharacterized protein n=1 Tax=Rosa chinensis TaxID=74649 RepID=A0A2P6QB30_ROSCH|nr:hypothetical protein RchiOBHm_Chr5g0034851 [Rosa chinensis]